MIIINMRLKHIFGGENVIYLLAPVTFKPREQRLPLLICIHILVICLLPAVFYFRFQFRGLRPQYPSITPGGRKCVWTTCKNIRFSPQILNSVVLHWNHWRSLVFAGVGCDVCGMQILELLYTHKCGIFVTLEKHKQLTTFFLTTTRPKDGFTRGQRKVVATWELGSPDHWSRIRGHSPWPLRWCCHDLG